MEETIKGIEVIAYKGNVTFFAGMSEFVNHPLASRIMTDEIIDLTF